MAAVKLPPGYDGKPQAAQVDKLQKKVATTPEAIQKQLQDTKDHFMKVLTATFKSQNPLTAGDKDSTHQIAQTQAAMAGAEASITAAAVAAEIREEMAGSPMLRAKEFHGQKVHWDDSIRTFSGKQPTTFTYHLTYPQDDRLKSAGVSATAIIKDSDGKKVFSKKIAGLKNGQNTYVWDGKNDRDITVESGDYSIEIKAHYSINNNGKMEEVPIQCTTTKSGIVEAIDSDKGEVYLVVGSDRIKHSSVIKMEDPSKQKGEQTKSIISDYVGYLGKSAEIKLDHFEVAKYGSVEVRLLAPTELSEVKMEVFDSRNIRVAVVKQKAKFAEGANSFMFNPLANEKLTDLKDLTKLSRLPPGHYTYKITGTTPDAREIKLSNSKTVTFTGISKDKLVAGNEEYYPKDISRLDVPKQEPQTMDPIVEGAKYLGKVITYDDDQIDWNKEPVGTFVHIPKPAANHELHKVEMLVFQGDKVIARVAPQDLYHGEIEDPPITIGALHNVSQPVVKEWCRKEFGGADDENGFTQDQKTQLQKTLAAAFREGKIFKLGQNLNDENVKLRNMGQMHIKWDGKIDGGLTALPGAYRREIVYEIKNTTDNTLRDHKLNLTIGSRVISTDVQGGQLVLITESGSRLKPNRVKNVGV